MDGDPDTCSVTPRTPELRWWQVKLAAAELVQRVAVTIEADTRQHFSIFVIELLGGNNALYKPCSEFDGFLHAPRVMFECNEGKGHFGDFVYIRDERAEHEHFGLCEVEVVPFTAPGLDFAQCADPVSPRGGYTVLANFRGVNRAGSVATTVCDPGRVLRGPADSVCGDDGTWRGVRGEAGAAATCELVTCLPPPDLEHVHMELLNDTLAPGAAIRYTCQHSPHHGVSRCLEGELPSCHQHSVFTHPRNPDIVHIFRRKLECDISAVLS